MSGVLRSVRQLLPLVSYVVLLNCSKQTAPEFNVHGQETTVVYWQGKGIMYTLRGICFPYIYKKQWLLKIVCWGCPAQLLAQRIIRGRENRQG